MTEQNSSQNASPPELSTGPSLLSRLMVAGFMGVVILGECLFAYLWIPSSTELESRLEAQEPQPQQPSENPDPEAPPSEPVMEVELGQYTVTCHQPSSNTTLRIDFHLYATVLEKDRVQFETMYTSTQHRLRDTIIFEIRNCEVTDLTDPGLALIKRRILEKSNRLFGKPILRSIIFSNYSLYEQ